MTLSRQSRRAVRRRAAVLFAATLIPLALAPRAGAAEGDFDATFGTGGIAITTSAQMKAATDLIVNSDSTILAAGFVAPTPTSANFLLARFSAAGVLTQTRALDFAQTADRAQAMALQSNGRIVLAGSANTTDTSSTTAIARFEADFDPDPTFNATGKVRISVGTGGESQANDVMVQPDGKIVLAGWARHSSGRYDHALVRLLSGGGLDSSFGSGGITLTMVTTFGGAAHGMALQSDGKILVAGDKLVGAAAGDLLLARYRSNGTLDPGFGVGGIVSFNLGSNGERFQAVVQLQNGKILAAGRSGISWVVARFTSNGEPDPSFDGDGIVLVPSSGSLRAMAIQADDKIVLAGSAFSAIEEVAVVRLLPTGVPDTSFSGDGKVATDFGSHSRAFAVAIGPDAKIVAAGEEYADGFAGLVRLIGDQVPPVNPALASSHTPSGWSNDNTVQATWSGASDDNAGVAGFSFLWNQSAATTPDATSDAAAAVASATSPPLADGNSHFVHLRTIDKAGNLAAAVHRGPFFIDTTTPTNPTSLSSTSHTTGAWSTDSTVDVAWSGASDASSGVDGYSYLWTISATTTPDQTKEAEETFTQATSPALATGDSHWFHLRTRDVAGNWSGAAHLGPFWIDAGAPTDPLVSSPSHTVDVWSRDATIDATWSGASGGASGVDGYSFLWDTSAATLPDEVKDAEETATGTTSPALTDGGSHFFHLRTRSNAGAWTSTVHLGPFKIDTVKPTGAALGGTAITRAFQTSTRVPLSWSATDALSGIVSYDLRYRRARFNGNFGSLATWRSATTDTSGTFQTTSGYTYCIQVRGRDAAGNVSIYSAERCTGIPVDDRALVRTGSWTDRTAAGTYFGTYRTSRTRGSKLQLLVTAKRLAVLVTRCFGCGAIEVFFGSQLLETIPLAAATTQKKVLVEVANFGGVRTGTVTIRVKTQGKTVAIDGMGISRK